MLPQTLVIPEFLFLTFILILLVSIFVHSKFHKRNGRKYPPGPKPMPIIGNLHMLGKLPHRTLQSLSQKYGPIMSLKLGQVQTIVVSSPQIAELFLKTHDSIFCNRPNTFASSYLSYGRKGLVFTEYGDYWRNMRKLCNTQLLHTSKVEMFAPLRKEEVGFLIKSLRKSATLHEVVDVSKIVAELIENINYKMILGRSKDNKFDFKELVHDEFTLVGMFNLGDYLPWLRPFDLQGIKRRCKKTRKQLDELLELIKKNTTILINAWTIGRDTKVWSDNAELFCPERFEDGIIDVYGHDFQLLPFSSGRRRCPGIEMGLRTSKLIVAQLMHCFNWELLDSMSLDDLDMSEKFELSMPKSQPLLAMPTYRLNP